MLRFIALVPWDVLGLELVLGSGLGFLQLRLLRSRGLVITVLCMSCCSDNWSLAS